MRYKVILKQYKQPGHMVVQLADGRLLRGPAGDFHKHLAVGSTGNVEQARKGLRFVPDAIEGEYSEV